MRVFVLLVVVIAACLLVALQHLVVALLLQRTHQIGFLAVVDHDLVVHNGQDEASLVVELLDVESQLVQQARLRATAKSVRRKERIGR